MVDQLAGEERGVDWLLQQRQSNRKTQDSENQSQSQSQSESQS